MARLTRHIRAEIKWTARNLAVNLGTNDGGKSEHQCGDEPQHTDTHRLYGFYIHDLFCNVYIQAAVEW